MLTFLRSGHRRNPAQSDRSGQHVGPGGGRYVFLLIGWNDYADPVRDELNRQADAFGMDLGPSGLLVQAYPQRMYEIAREVLGKSWPAEIAERFHSDPDPIILIIDRDWQSFDPSEHAFGIIWVSRFSNDPETVRPFLQTLARLSREGDVITYLREVAAREQRAAAVDTTQRTIGLLARAASYIEIKPSVFGVAVDLKAILRDIAERRG
jgi:hypothetical protein